MKGQKYLIPLAVGVGVLLLVIFAAALFSSGNEEASAGAGAAAVALLEAERRRQARAKAQADLDEQARRAEESNKRLDGIWDEYEDARRKNDQAVAKTPLADLVDEENNRRT